MIGIDIGSLNTTVSLGKQNSSTSKFQCELILSDTSARSCPSIISYTETLRLIGDQASLVLRSNIQSSFHYLSRLIGILPNSNFGKREFNEYILYSGNYNPQNNTFNFTINNQNYSFSPDEIIVGYLNKVKYQYIIEQRIQPTIYVFSVPDYFTCHTDHNGACIFISKDKNQRLGVTRDHRSDFNNIPWIFTVLCI